MWFVWFYTISTIICYIVMSIMALGMKQQLKRMNMLNNNKKIKIVEKISVFLPFLVPFVNIILVLIGVFAQDEIFEKIVQKIKDKKENENKENN